MSDDRFQTASSSFETEPLPAITPTELALKSIWAKLLGIDDLNLQDDFFFIGGDSLTATQIISRVFEDMHVQLKLDDFFDSPTITDLAIVILQHQAELLGYGQCLSLLEDPDLLSDDQASPIKERILALSPAKRIVFEQRLMSLLTAKFKHEGRIPRLHLDKASLSFSQERMWILSQLQPDSPVYNVLRTIRIKGPIDVMTLTKSLNEIVRRHEILRTSFQEIDGQLLQVISPHQELELAVTALSNHPETEREALSLELAIKTGQQIFDLRKPSLLSVKLLRLGEQDNILIVVMHHIVSDGWSMQVLMRELGQIYEAYARRERSPLEELPVQYADYAVWQRQWLQGELLDEQLRYWSQRLAGAPDQVSISSDRARPTVMSGRGGVERLEVSQEVSGRLKEMSRGEGATIFMTMLAAFNVLLMRYSGQVDIVVGTPIANRTRGEVEPLIGFFVNTLVIRTELSGEPTFKQLLGRVREACVGAYAHQDLPFERLVEELQPDRNLSRSPLFQVAFSLHSSSDSSLQLDALSLSQTRVENRHVEVRPLPCRQQHARRAEGLH